MCRARASNVHSESYEHTRAVDKVTSIHFTTLDLARCGTVLITFSLLGHFTAPSRHCFHFTATAHCLQRCPQRVAQVAPVAPTGRRWSQAWLQVASKLEQASDEPS